jgi:hypothetical protein
LLKEDSMSEQTYSRHCSHCFKELTDPASRESGVGPICRNKNNELLAKAIKGNIGVAYALIEGVDVSTFPSETHASLNYMKVRILDKLCTANHSNDSLLKDGVDFRTFVNKIEYVLSYSIHYSQREYLIRVIENLGYIGLASVFRGEASRSKAKIWFENGRLCLLGKHSKEGRYAFRRIRGTYGPRYRGQELPYRVLAANFDAFVAVVNKYWPFYEGDFETLRQQVEMWNLQQEAANNSQVFSAPEQNDVATIHVYSNSFTFKGPWVFERNSEMHNMVRGLKVKIPPEKRKYNPDTKEWTFSDLALQNTVSEIIGQVYGRINVVN